MNKNNFCRLKRDSQNDYMLNAAKCARYKSTYRQHKAVDASKSVARPIDFHSYLFILKHELWIERMDAFFLAPQWAMQMCFNV